MCVPNILVKKTPEYLNSAEKNHKKLKCWSCFCVNYFLRYYLMMRHQPIVKRVNGAHTWAHGPYQLLITAACTKTGPNMKGSRPEQLTGAHLYLDIAKSGYLLHCFSGGMLKCSEETMYLHFMSFLHTDMPKVIEIPPRIRPGLIYFT